MKSHFTSQTLAEIFRDLYLGERSGVLHLEREETEKRVCFDRGLIHYADSSDGQENLGEKLIAQQKISPGALDEAQKAIGNASELARALLNRGLIGREALMPTVWEIVESVIQSVFHWEGGAARFEDDEPGVSVLDGDVLSTFDVILRGIYGMSDFGPIGEALRGLDNRLRMRKPTPLPVERLTLSPSHGFVLSRVDGTTTMNDILSIVPPGDEESAEKFLFGLLVMGVLEYHPPLGEGPFRVANILRDHADRRALERMQEQTLRQAYAQMRRQSPYEILGVAPTASRQAIEHAYNEAKSLFSRERILPKVREEYRSELAVIESRLIESYLRLTQAGPQETHAAPQPESANSDVGVNDLLVRVEMDKTRSKRALDESKKAAGDYYVKALKAQREGDYHNAIQYGKLAISYDPEDSRLYYMLADCQVRNPGPRWQHQAEQNYTKATELDPWNASYWVSLGRFYKKRGLKLRARKQFEEALKLSPDHEEATREISGLG